MQPRILVIGRNARGRYYAALAGSPANYTRKTLTAALRDAYKLEAWLKMNRIPYEVRNFVDAQ